MEDEQMQEIPMRWLIRIRVMQDEKAVSEDYLVDGASPEAALASLAKHLNQHDMLGALPLDVVSLKGVEIRSLVLREGEAAK
jgi:hypothetical protein